MHRTWAAFHVTAKTVLVRSPACCVAQRWCSSSGSSSSESPSHPTRTDAAAVNPFASSVAKTLREKVFSKDFAAMKVATPKEEELLKKWRTGDGTPEQSPRQPETPGTADPSDVEPQMAEGSRDVAGTYGQSFRDTRPMDPNEGVEVKRRRLIYQSRYRGMVEMDLIFGHFARCKLRTLDAAMLDEYDTLLKQLDSDLFRWLVMNTDAPAEVQGLRCFKELRKFIEEERAELLGPN
ncbi:putative mitochondrial hypothetical protein [Leptomonas pyrrhocoris]|uniref:Succinate dehydrogenase assembly factor 2, mitochondrial n=1 Tax=Leptomonas pyrrhocoris TaxID=157538 RepID=A0A0M9G629_LEPPY|nr:putative mitochondrial hypothetical protein [Leptomonas pyrrhocoris]KPA83117.1 putative mitochondrial hypothetical protein [Leptomonas pyrrhocoris]|eukprot:XP_015661556.1 putative mitochondrial hypothetical protein [Leptomonas pyrrhocoris]